MGDIKYRIQRWWGNFKYTSIGKAVANPTAMLVIGFLILILIAFAHTAEAEGNFSAEIGQTLINVEGGTSLWIDSRYDVGPGDSILSVAIFTITEAEYKGRPTSMQGGIHVQLVDYLGPLELGLGVAYQQTDELVVSTPFRFSLLVGLVGDNPGVIPDYIRWRHLSNAGSGGFAGLNRGWDMVTLGWKF